MAIYHCSTKPLSRSTGRSAVAAAAYRSGAKITEERTGEIHDYRRKSGVESAELVLPAGIAADRATLWNAAETSEKRKDARTAREWVIALPAELNQQQRRELAHEFAGKLVRIYGVAADVAIHRPDREGDNRNHHAHILTTTRQAERGPDGVLVLGEKASIELSDKRRRELGMGPAAEEVADIRTLWERAANRALERAGHTERITARSLAAQGIDRAPTTHLGPVATQMERRGVQSDRGDGNRRTAASNEQRAALRAEAREVDEQARIAAQQATTAASKTPAPEQRYRWEEERAKVQRVFTLMAKGRETGADGWNDGQAQWRAVPERLRELIEGYNAVPVPQEQREEARAVILDRIMQSFGQEQLRDLLVEQIERFRAVQATERRNRDHDMER